MIAAAIMIILGSVSAWWFHIDYFEIYDAIKEDNKDFTKDEICSILVKNDLKAILSISFILWLINPALLFVSIGALMSFLTVKIPSLERALSE